jgi:hypothetical protein
VNTDRLGNYSGELKQGVDALAGLTKRTRRIKEFRRAGDRLSLASHNAPLLSEMRHDFLGKQRLRLLHKRGAISPRWLK